MLRKQHKVISDVDITFFTPTTGKPVRKGLVLSDIHMPFHPPDLLNDIVKQHSDADALFINGDLVEGYNISHFMKEKYIPMMFEYALALEWLYKMSKIFKDVYITRGNHEFRLNKQVWSKLSPDVLWRVQNEADLLVKLADGIILNEQAEEVGQYDFSNVTYEGCLGQEPWWTKWGQTIICHPYKGSSDYNAKTARNFAEKYFTGNQESFDCVIAAHTHQVAEIYVNGKKYIEQGCITSPLDYAKRGTESYAPQQLGYALIYQDKNNNTIFDMTRAVYLGVMCTHKSGDLKARVRARAKEAEEALKKQLASTKKTIKLAKKK